MDAGQRNQNPEKRFEICGTDVKAEGDAEDEVED